MVVDVTCPIAAVAMATVAGLAAMAIAVAVTVVAMATAIMADVIAVGSLERNDYDPADLQAVVEAGEIVVEKDGAFLIRVRGPRPE